MPVVFGGVSAAYIPVQDAPAGSTVYLAVEADRADGSYASFYYPLTSNGVFMNLGATGGTYLGGTGKLTDANVTDLFFYGYFCNGKTGSCSAFNTNQGQFALDNIILTAAAVPEPETYALLLAGLFLTGVAVRRKKTA
ncbi:PEP-CTERM sorting domain-containing protein [Pseudoduganella sp. FT26W]|uniref:PEP-CTERM sorting domain-containing protein n=2 Tax=Duganella aquatilis TaxID=2666082 RepID=A0A844DBK8_9BURK|nr:PEP-CTERM sorting domain-containing protein [Duganella aquatilis]